MDDLKLTKHLTFDQETVAVPNLCERFESVDLEKIGNWVYQGYMLDKVSRAKWEKRMQAALDLALQVQKNKTFPWPGASNVVFPLITIAALQFSSKSYVNIIQGTDVVRYRVIGEDKGGVLKQRAERLGRHMSWQALEQDEAWEEQHDRLLINLAIVGSNFIKTYWCPRVGGPVSELVLAQDLVVDYYAKSIDSAARKTQRLFVSRNEVWENITSGIYRDVREEEWYNAAAPAYSTGGEEQARVDNRTGQMPPASDSLTPWHFLEQHVLMDLDGDGYQEPYIVTIEEESKAVLRIVARVDSWKQVDVNSQGEILGIKPTEHFTKYGFIPSPDGAIYDLGFGIFLGPINEAVNSAINQLLDNGTLQTSMGGFLGRGAKIRGGVYTMAPWEWKRVDSTGDDLRKNLIPYPKSQPSDVLFKLAELLIEYANRVAGTVDTMVGENPGQNTPASTFQGMQEQGMAVYGTIFKRVWRSMKEEMRKRFLINRHSLAENVHFGMNGVVRPEDYRGSEDLIAPVADPNLPSTTLRLTQAQAVMQMAERVPGFSLPEAVTRTLKALKVEDIESLYPGPDKVPPLPNPKIQVEQGKLQVKAAEFQQKRQKEQLDNFETQRLNTAKIAHLRAQAAAIVAEIGGKHGDQRLQAIQLALDALTTHNEILDRRQQALKEEGQGDGNIEQQDGGGRGSQARGSRPMAKAPNDAASTDNPTGVEGSDTGSVGEQGVSTGDTTGDSGG